MDTAVFPVSEAVAFLGPIGTGKSQQLVQRTAALLAEGALPHDVMVLCASPQAADDFARRLADAECNDVRVLTPRALALEILSTPEALAFSGRRPSVMLPYQEDFLMDDMRVLGVKDKRLSEMLRFFDRMDDELRDEADWLQEGEEAAVRARLKTCLRAVGAYRDVEVSAYAVRFLQANPQILAKLRIPHLIIDDYTLLGRASQLLGNLVAARSVAIAADPFDTLPVFERFPFAAGVGDFLEANAGAAVEVLDRARSSRVSASVARALIAAGPLAAAWGPDGRGHDAAQSSKDDCWELLDSPQQLPGDFEIRGVGLMEEEMPLVADEVARCIEEGVAPDEVAVLCFRGPQMHRMALSLRKRGIATATRGSQKPGGDVHDPLNCEEERALALLALAADRCDMSAWRAMMGFGDSLGRSWAFDQLRTAAADRDQSILEIIELAASGGDGADEAYAADIAPLVQIYRAVTRQLDRMAFLSGPSLIQAVGRATVGDKDARTIKLLAALLKTAAPEDTAKALYQRAVQLRLEPTFSSGVRIGTIQDLALTAPRVLFVMGFVNGFIPPRKFFDKTAIVEKDARKVWAQGAQELYRVFGAVAQRIVVTYFTRIDPERAQRTRVHVERIRMENDARVCVTGPSDYLAILKDAVDGATL